jgi:MFS family permease
MGSMTFLFLASGIGVLLPYMTIHMKSLGITVEEIGIIYGIVPFAAILAPSAMGMIADKIGNFKVCRSMPLSYCQ